LLNNLIIAAIPHTEPWRLTTAIVMIICNLLAIAITFGSVQLRSKIRVANPDDKSIPGRGFGLPELFAAMSFGHVLGVGVVLGLTNIGII
jgi:photosystem I subunit X